MITEVLMNNHKDIHVLNRAQIIDDAFNLARANQMDYRLALGFTQYLERELDYVVWKPANAGLGYIGRMLRRTPAYGHYLVKLTLYSCT